MSQSIPENIPEEITIPKDSSSEDEYSSENESEPDNVDNITSLLNPLNLTDNSDLYVVSVDNVPRFYVKDEKSASEKMWEIARLLAIGHFTSGYRTNYLQLSNNQLHLVGSYRFFLISYDQTLHRFSYSKIKECI